ncbi:hypothetical protein ISCGN_003078 [Ixodes scapularis]
MIEACTQSRVVNGINGPTPLIQLKGMDLVWGFSPDYMHAVLEGVTRQLTELWLTCTTGPFYIGAQIREINARICKIRPPIGFPRLPRPLTERALWKASEWKAFLLFYALPCLSDILPPQFFRHFSMLSQAVFLLLKEAVTEQDVHASEGLLTEFVRKCALLYKEPAATFNVHILLHLPKSVQMLGPLWGTSTFPYENKIGSILRQISASRYVPYQIGERCVMHATLGYLKEAITLPPRLKTLCRQMLHTRKEVRGTKPLGTSQIEDLPENHLNLLSERFGFLPRTTSYERAQINGVVFSRTSYGRAQKTCSQSNATRS